MERRGDPLLNQWTDHAQLQELSKHRRKSGQMNNNRKKYSYEKQKIPALQEKLIHTLEQISGHLSNNREKVFCMRAVPERARAPPSDSRQGEGLVWEAQRRIKSLHTAQRPPPWVPPVHLQLSEQVSHHSVIRNVNSSPRTNNYFPFFYYLFLTSSVSSYVSTSWTIPRCRTSGIKVPRLISTHPWVCLSTTPCLSHKAQQNHTLCRGWQENSLQEAWISLLPTVRVIVVHLAVSSFPTATLKMKPMRMWGGWS